MIDVNRFIDLADGDYANTRLIDDYSYRRIGGEDGLQPGGAIHHTVREGESSQSLAALYFGSPDYWYLIADANGIGDMDELAAGTRLIIPQQIAQSINNAGAYSTYQPGDIIGQTALRFI